MHIPESEREALKSMPGVARLLTFAFDMLEAVADGRFTPEEIRQLIQDAAKYAPPPSPKLEEPCTPKPTS